LGKIKKTAGNHKNNTNKESSNLTMQKFKLKTARNNGVIFHRINPGR